ncbi:MAG: TraR/DksA C4-type zinc finger protein [Patescibacteria group bacterium]|jgi:RNA polymerase-binding protein DksA
MNDAGYPKKVLSEVEEFFKKERAHIAKRIKQLDEGDPFKDPDHANDNADVINEVREEMAHEQTEANRESLKKRITEIDEVLKRIANGSYGYCKKCGKMINTDRLTTNPLAVLCIDCAKK